MTNILTAAEAAITLRSTVTDTVLLNLLDGIDTYIENATGRDWTRDATVAAEAKNAARMLLVLWYENPAMVGITPSLHFGLSAALSQLEARALEYHVFQGLDGTGGIELANIEDGDQVVSVTGLIGVSGDQSAGFESEISGDGFLVQESESDLSEYWFEARIVSPGAMR